MSYTESERTIFLEAESASLYSLSSNFRNINNALCLLHDFCILYA